MESIGFDEHVIESELPKNNKKKNSNIFGVKFTNKEIASIYCKQTNFRGVGIWIEQNLVKEIQEKTEYKIVTSFFYKKEDKNSKTIYSPKCYFDIPLFEMADTNDPYGEKRKKNILSIILQVLYTSHCKSIKYSAYYISLIVNIIRCCDTRNIKWNKSQNVFENMSTEFQIVYNFLLEGNLKLNELIGLDCVCLAFLNELYNSENLTNYDKAEITEYFMNIFPCLSKYKHSLDTVPNEPFTQDNRKKFINYCNTDMARQFVDNIIKK